jgi:predicted metal-dependent hydrolase
MSRKSQKVAAGIEKFKGQKLEAHYLGYFDCFNRQLFYEAHDVLEPLWLAEREGENGAFYKGLIQLAGAFVHLQKDRLGPASSLFKLAETNLRKYQGQHLRLDVAGTLKLIEEWARELELSGAKKNPLDGNRVPALQLISGMNGFKVD